MNTLSEDQWDYDVMAFSDSLSALDGTSNPYHALDPLLATSTVLQTPRQEQKSGFQNMHASRMIGAREAGDPPLGLIAEDSWTEVQRLQATVVSWQQALSAHMLKITAGGGGNALHTPHPRENLQPATINPLPATSSYAHPVMYNTPPPIPRYITERLPTSSRQIPLSLSNDYFSQDLPSPPAEEYQDVVVAQNPSPLPSSPEARKRRFSSPRHEEGHPTFAPALRVPAERIVFQSGYGSEITHAIVAALHETQLQQQTAGGAALVPRPPVFVIQVGCCSRCTESKKG
ncbi:hypothetical protein HKX48_000719 [Thoreauomyces humboldtii]|nr:hypothetical protein HKX48_000719 [Thoreauomyces humboldtii]